jgi:hypothetical protein
MFGFDFRQAQAEIDRLAACGERFRQVRRTMEQVVPTGATLATSRCASVTRKHRVDQGQLPDAIARKQRGSECHRASPIVAHEMKCVDAEQVQQLDDVACDCSVVISMGRAGTVAEPAHIRRDDPIGL